MTSNTRLQARTSHFFHFRRGHGSATTWDKPLGSDSRTVPLRWRGSDKRGGDEKLEPRGHADINHGLGYINNIYYKQYKQYWTTCHWKAHLDHNYFPNTRVDYYKNYCVLQCLRQVLYISSRYINIYPYYSLIFVKILVLIPNHYYNVTLLIRMCHNKYYK